MAMATSSLVWALLKGCADWIFEQVWVRRLKFSRGPVDYNLKKKDDPRCTGWIPTERHWGLEGPRPPESEKFDYIIFHGFQSEGLAICIGLGLYGDGALVEICIRQPGGSFLTLSPRWAPCAPSDQSVFYADGLKIQCLSPFRRWRIFFNGLLKDSSSSEWVHARLTLIWLANGQLHDHLDAAVKGGARQLAKCSVKWSIPSDRIEAALDLYEQCGMMTGELDLPPNNKQVLTCWTVRSRGHVHQDIAGHHDHRIYGYNKDGISMSLHSLSIPSLLNRYNYGFVTPSNGMMYTMVNPTTDSRIFTFMAGTRKYRLELNPEKTEHGSFVFCNGWVNGDMIPLVFSSFGELSSLPALPTFLSLKAPRLERPLVVPLTNPEAMETELTGGKGASLAKLVHIRQAVPLFDVPTACVVTTAAYSVQRKCWPELGDTRDLDELSPRMTKAIQGAALHPKVREALRQQLAVTVGADWSQQTLAVRSSSTGEDGATLSAAGQMETFLGVRGEEEVYNAVASCWASQFSPTNLHYKKRCGQLLESPMAVVVQRLVPARTAGVLFTCDPATSDPRMAVISANFGLGESVVGARAEPDTIVLRKASPPVIQSYSVGAKSVRVEVDGGNGGTVEVDNSQDQRDNRCLSEDDQCVKLVTVGQEVEKIMGCPQDIEWAMDLEGNILLLQSRPVTSLDPGSTYELSHDVDSGQRSEMEVLSRANVGEVMPGAFSPLGLSLLIEALEIYWQTRLYERGLQTKEEFCPHYTTRLQVWTRQVFFNLLDTFFRYNFGKTSDVIQGFMFALLSRQLDDSQWSVRGVRRHGLLPTARKLLMILNGLRERFFFSSYERTIKAGIAALEPPKCLTAAEQFEALISLNLWMGRAMGVHGFHTRISSTLNFSIMNILRSSHGEWNTAVYSDFALLTSACEGLESAEVPSQLQEMAVKISQRTDPQQFSTSAPREALTWLQSSMCPEFEAFLRRHGHRCIKEFDVHSVPWGVDPIPLVRTLQSLAPHLRPPPPPSPKNVLDSLQTDLSPSQRKELKKILPSCQEAVRKREESKSLIIRVVNTVRITTERLGLLMETEGFLPERRLVYFLAAEEIDRLLVNRNPWLVDRAMKRQKIHLNLDKYKFEELTEGVPIPMNLLPKKEPIKTSFQMKGTPVSQGVARGRARVVVDVHEAAELQAGEILITYSTDIGWTPYFPLLAGLVTEIGGLISHGAVVAREYGLPCVISAKDATQLFQTGDMVEVDGSKGLISKIV